MASGSSVKLNQVIAVVTGKKGRAEETLTRVHHSWKPDRLTGISRTYASADEDGEQFDPESRLVQTKVWDVLRSVKTGLFQYIDVVATQEYGNTVARGDIVVDGEVILSAVPVGILLFLQKKLVDLQTFVSQLPTLPEDRQWTWSDGKGCYESNSEKTVKTKKVNEPMVLYPATPEHPAQTQMVTVDRTIGHWTKTEFSGAIPVQRKNDILVELQKLHEAVVIAREQANATTVEQHKIADALLGNIFDKLIKQK